MLIIANEVDSLCPSPNFVPIFRISSGFDTLRFRFSHCKMVYNKVKSRKAGHRMPLQIVRNDITTMQVDAIVNAANESLLGGGGVDGCIHRAAGPKLLAECRTLHGCKTGSAKITKGYNLPCQYVIHTVGPRWHGGQYGEHDQLVSCYQTSLQLAEEYGCKSIAFPLISSGIFGYPKEQALKVAIDTIQNFLLTHDMTVYLVIFDQEIFSLYQSQFNR